MGQAILVTVLICSLPIPTSIRTKMQRAVTHMPDRVSTQSSTPKSWQMQHFCGIEKITRCSLFQCLRGIGSCFKHPLLMGCIFRNQVFFMLYSYLQYFQSVPVSTTKA